MGLEVLQRHKLNRRHVCRFEDDWWRAIGFECFFPTRNAQAPAVTGDQTRELIHRYGSYQIVADTHREFEKCFCHLHADDVQTVIGLPGPSVTIAIETSHGIRAARLQFSSQDVFR